MRRLPLSRLQSGFTVQLLRRVTKPARKLKLRRFGRALRNRAVVRSSRTHAA